MRVDDGKMKVKILEAFEPFADLDEKSKLVAAKLISIHTVHQAETLFHIGDTDSTEYFLVSGDIELVATDGIKKSINASDSAAHFPLALLRPRKFTAQVKSEHARIIMLDVGTLRRIRMTVPVSGDDFSTFSAFRDHNQDESTFSIETDADAIKKFLVGASHAIKENRLSIANFDNVSSTIFNVIRDPKVGIDEVVSAVQLDAAISAKLIKAANSAFYGGMAKVDSVRAAVVRLGLDLSSQLISVMVLKEVFHSSKETLQDAMGKLWTSSLKLATYSVIVAKHANIQIQQGQSLLAGLMNDIGLLVIIAYLDQFPGSMKIISEQVLSSSVFKKKLGSELLNHWEFPASIIDVIENSDDFSRDLEQPDLCDVVCIAQYLIRMTSYRRLPFDDITETEAFKRLDFGEQSENIVSKIQEEAHRYTELFTGAFAT